ncbi:MAG: site-specific DNA-methyltransferase [Elusimicrobia bacterium]|nr:site-specific DNA-methyltransferase [Elusimicrobiota bacterium]
MAAFTLSKSNKTDIAQYLADFKFYEKQDLFSDDAKLSTQIEFIRLDGREYPQYINEYWTSKQRQADPLHEITYRACFKPQLPRFFIELLTKKDDIVYDPFSGRGTTVIEAALLGRNIIANDVNPLSKILAYPRFFVPTARELEGRLSRISMNKKAKADMDLSMFYHPQTEAEIVSLKNYLQERKDSGKEDNLDAWIRMIATNRLTGHSVGFFSVYTLPPNQAVKPESQVKINQKRNQKPEYRNTKEIILRKFNTLTQFVSEELRARLKVIGEKARFFSQDARSVPQIPSRSVHLTVTSPPFLDVVQYADDNWLRCWFNGIDAKEIENKITTSKTIGEWSGVMGGVLKELYRITKSGGSVAFEVGEVRNGRLKLDEYIVSLGTAAGFKCQGIIINRQEFTKTSNIWGIKNNESGTNTNRIVLLKKA